VNGCIVNGNEFIGNCFPSLAVIRSKELNGRVGNADTCGKSGSSEIDSHFVNILSFAKIKVYEVVAVILVGRSVCAEACPDCVCIYVFGYVGIKNAVGKSAAFIGICDGSVGIITPVYILTALTELFGNNVILACNDVVALNKNGFFLIVNTGDKNVYRGLIVCNLNLVACLESDSSKFGLPVEILVVAVCVKILCRISVFCRIRSGRMCNKNEET
jgi:hypothetical protein